MRVCAPPPLAAPRPSRTETRTGRRPAALARRTGAGTGSARATTARATSTSARLLRPPLPQLDRIEPSTLRCRNPLSFAGPRAPDDPPAPTPPRRRPSAASVAPSAASVILPSCSRMGTMRQRAKLCRACTHSGQYHALYPQRRVRIRRAAAAAMTDGRRGGARPAGQGKFKPQAEPNMAPKRGDSRRGACGYLGPDRF